jgi:dihydroflavonol-4-reductase
MNQSTNRPINQILLTGGTGFLGAYILKNLVEKGIAVRALRRSAKVPFFIPASVLDKIEWVEGDVLDVVSLDEAMKGVDAVIHSAAIVSFSKQNRKEMYAVNVDGTANVVNTALENGVRRLVHVSSVAALGRTTKSATVTEDKQWEENPNNTHYAISKHSAEMQAWRGFAEGLEGVILNPSTILGYGDWHQSSCAIFRNVYRGMPWYTNGVNGFVGVEDVAEAAVRLLQSDIHAERFIVNADNISFRQLLTMIAEGFGKRPPHREAARWMGNLAWRLEALKSMFTGSKPLLTKETAKVSHSRTSFNNEKLLTALPDFHYNPLPTIIQKACAQYQSALQKGEITL